MTINATGQSYYVCDECDLTLKTPKGIDPGYGENLDNILDELGITTYKGAVTWEKDFENQGMSIH